MPGTSKAPAGSPYDTMMLAAEHRIVTGALAQCGRNVQNAARLLGVTETFLARRCDRLAIQLPPKTRRKRYAPRRVGKPPPRSGTNGRFLPKTATADPAAAEAVPEVLPPPAT